jgi:hypothetical protein
MNMVAMPKGAKRKDLVWLFLAYYVDKDSQGTRRGLRVQATGTTRRPRV